ncbi:MAG: hypothetical protein KC547_08045 [Anaerolineae bacterium]|nr:hypothetical protein [Anaerolineae bacterium]MCA9910633.1 hypothetical protein [Anaerolineae bacterium]
MNPSVPTGNSDQIVQQYFHHLYSYYLDRIQQTYYIHWDIVFGVVFWVFVLVALFYFYSRWQRNTSNYKEPYPVESFNGYIQESNGPVGPFLTVFFIAMFLWILAVTILNLVNGQIY